MDKDLPAVVSVVVDKALLVINKRELCLLFEKIEGKKQRGINMWGHKEEARK